MDLKRQAEELANRPVRGVIPVAGSGNNRLYRVDCGDAVYALKVYPPSKNDPRDRLASETSAVTFMVSHGADMVPGLVAADRDAGLALFEWIEGKPVTETGAGDVTAALAFVAFLQVLGGKPGSESLGPASEACLSGAELLAQVRRRAEALGGVSGDDPELAEFLDHDFGPALEQVSAAVSDSYDKAGIDLSRDLSEGLRILSPSDFGFHNCLRAPGGRLFFLDFEYFGWDDPVKLVADFLLHPGMDLSGRQKRQFFKGARRIFRGDDHFDTRLALLYPLYGLRWCMILLNEFLPDGWRRRVYAGVELAHAEAKDRQLAKAKTLLEGLKADRGNVPHDT